MSKKSIYTASILLAIALIISIGLGIIKINSELAVLDPNRETVVATNLGSELNKVRLTERDNLALDVLN